jgi:hypothetical protein
VLPIPRTPNTEDGRYSLATWRTMNRQIYRAAIDGGAAFVPTNWLSDVAEWASFQPRCVVQIYATTLVDTSSQCMEVLL